MTCAHDSAPSEDDLNLIKSSRSASESVTNDLNANFNHHVITSVSGMMRSILRKLGLG